MDLYSRPAPVADHRIAYGAGQYQFGDLWLPESHGKTLPLVVFFHGGWWRSDFDLSYAGHLCVALKRDGIAAWSVEYRRVGETGGGWPTTFQDVGAGCDFVATLAKRYSLDVKRVITMGHSAGGHLAMWAAGRHHLDAKSAVYAPHQLSLRGAVALAGAVSLRETIDLSGEGIYAHDRDEVFALMGGRPQDFPERYKAGDPGELLPFNVPQILIQGTEDNQIPPELPERWAQMARRAGDTVIVKIVPGADHRDVADPESKAWGTVRDAVQKLLSV
jgi:acetyl esterase/lipase